MSSPFLKWAGGKRWLIANRQLPIPQSFNRYIEPFLGSGAVFFHLKPQKAILSDMNFELICLYQTIRDFPIELFALMEYHQKEHSKTHYYKVRGSNPKTNLEKAARTLYLNRTCWNGLYRVNLKGEFNVPIGTKEKVILPSDDFNLVSSYLRQAKIECSDFESTIDKSENGDFLFVDPPYTVQHNNNGFLKYNEKIFSWDDQIRLRNAVERAANRGVSIAVTNADHSVIQDLYYGLAKYIQLTRYSILAGKSEKRSKTSEALFLINIV